MPWLKLASTSFIAIGWSCKDQHNSPWCEMTKNTLQKGQPADMFQGLLGEEMRQTTISCFMQLCVARNCTFFFFLVGPYIQHVSEQSICHCFIWEIISLQSTSSWTVFLFLQLMIPIFKSVKWDIWQVKSWLDLIWIRIWLQLLHVGLVEGVRTGPLARITYKEQTHFITVWVEQSNVGKLVICATVAKLSLDLLDLLDVTIWMLWCNDYNGEPR